MITGEIKLAIPILHEIERLITEHGSATILRERLLLLKDEIRKIEKENTDLKAALSTCEKETAQLRRQLSDRTIQEQFIEYNGMLFKRKPSGGYHRAVYCPSCRLPMGSLEDWMPLDCANCKIVASVSNHDLPRILKEIEKEYS